MMHQGEVFFAVVPPLGRHRKLSFVVILFSRGIDYVGTEFT